MYYGQSQCWGCLLVPNACFSSVPIIIDETVQMYSMLGHVTIVITCCCAPTSLFSISWLHYSAIKIKFMPHNCCINIYVEIEA